MTYKILVDSSANGVVVVPERSSQEDAWTLSSSQKIRYRIDGQMEAEAKEDSGSEWSDDDEDSRQDPVNVPANYDNLSRLK